MAYNAKTTGNGAGGVPGQITLPDFGGGQMDNALRAGWMWQQGDNPYFQNTTPGDGNLSLGGVPSKPEGTAFPAPVAAAPPPAAPPPAPTNGDGRDRNNLPIPPKYAPAKDWTGEGRQADTSWDWDAFAPKRQGDDAWGGFDKDYNAYERYQPGQDSPWGMPSIEGGNKEFYQQQFANLLRDEQGYRSRERAAQGRRQAAMDAPAEKFEMNWDWANNGKGLPEVNVSGGQLAEGVDPNSWQLNDNYGLESGMTNQEAVNSMNELWTPGESSQWSEYFANPSASPDGQYWASKKAGQDPNAILSGFQNVSPEFGSTVQKFINNAWTTAGDAAAGGVPAGYAAPN